MKRRAILIFNDGGPTNYLPGVKIDRDNYLRFLSSPEGGAWDDEEMMVYFNGCSKVQLLAYINTYRHCEQTEFWLIVFSGHGYSLESGDTILELSSGQECNVAEIEQATRYSRCLLIADSCRVVVRNISESLKFERKLFSDISLGDDYRKRCRLLYLNEIEKISNGSFNTAFAADFGQSAYDDDTTGGYYSSELLRAANEKIQDCKQLVSIGDYVFPFKNVHKIARQRVIDRTNGKQTPICKGYYIRTIPFIVVPKV